MAGIDCRGLDDYRRAYIPSSEPSAHLLPMGEGHLRESRHPIAFSYGEKVREAGMRGSEPRWNNSEAAKN